MSLEHKNPEKLLDETLQQIRDERLAARHVESAADRVWSRITQRDLTLEAVTAAPAEKIRTCEDMQTLIPAYLSGDLPHARTLLLEDHLQECVPCRRALRVARNGGKKTVERAKVRPSINGKLVASLAVAAVLLLALGLGSEGLLDRGRGPCHSRDCGRNPFPSIGQRKHPDSGRRGSGGWHRSPDSPGLKCDRSASRRVSDRDFGTG